MVRKCSTASLRCIKQSEESGRAEGGRGKGKGMMFLPRCSAGSGWGVEM